MGIFDNIFNIIKTKENNSLEMFLLNYINKKITNEDSEEIIKKILSYFSNINVNNKFNTIINILLNEESFSNGLDKQITMLINDLNLEKLKNESLKVDLKKLEDSENSAFGQKYNKYVQDKYFSFCSKVKEISKLNEVYESLMNYDTLNRVFYTLKNNPTKNNFEKFEKDLTKLIKVVNEKKHSIYNKNVEHLTRNLPTIKQDNNTLEYKEQSTKYLKQVLFKLSSNLINRTFTKNDLNKFINIFKRFEEDSKESTLTTNRNLSYYKISPQMINNNLNFYSNKINTIIELEEDINYYIDQSNKYLHNINKIDEVNLIFANLNNYVNNNIEKVDLELSNITLKIISKLESYDLLFKNYYPTKKSFKQCLETQEKLISEFDSNNFTKKINDLDVDIKKEIKIKENDKFRSFYA